MILTKTPLFVYCFQLLILRDDAKLFGFLPILIQCELSFGVKMLSNKS